MTVLRLSLGVANDRDGEPMMLIQMNDQWRMLPYAHAHLFVSQATEILDRIAASRGSAEAPARLLADASEYGPFIQTSSEVGAS